MFERFNGNVVPFADESTSTNRTVFGSETQSDDIDDNLNSDFKKGWEIVGLNDNPTREDFNAMGYTLGYLISYLYQNGVAEYNLLQEYKTSSIAIGADGNIYQSLVDSNLGNALTDTTKWVCIASKNSIVNSIVELKTISNIESINVLGYYEKGDGGGGTFYWDETSTEDDNGGTIIQATGVATGRWKRVFSGAINVKWFGVKGDGVTSNQSGIVAAIAAAYAIGEQLEWPAGTYVSTENIPNFHDVLHVGKGIVKRGAYTFAVEPTNKMSMRNRIYVSASGSGDGLSPDFPATLDVALAALSFRGPALNGLWGIQLAAGTYTAPTETLSNITSDNYILIAGPDVSGGVPTAIIDANGGEQALRIIGRCNVQLQDIKGVNATASSVASAFIIDNGGTVYAQNVHTNNTTWAGINFNHVQRAVVYGGVFENSGAYGVRCYAQTFFTIGLDRDRPLFKNCLTSGFISQGSSYGHCDYNDFVDCPTAITAQYQSHSTSYFNTFTNCNRLHFASSDSSISRKDNSGAGGTQDVASGCSTFSEDTATFRFFDQFYGTGTSGRSARGYSSNAFPQIPHQFSGGGTAGVSLTSHNSSSMLLEHNGNTAFSLLPATGSYSELRFGRGTQAVHFGIQDEASGDTLTIRNNGSPIFSFRPTDFFARVDNTISLGRDLFRFSTAYLGSSPILTSDEREKQQWRDQSQAEKVAALEIKHAIKAFKFSDAINNKGEAARWHFGVGAQTVGDILRSHGLNPEDYAFWCYDEWDETPEEREDGNIIVPYRPAGNRYGIRYEELICFIISAM